MRTARSPRWFWLGLIAVGVGARLLVAVGTDPYFDEAYYWVWSKNLSWSYFDHPPLIAWAIAALRSIRGTALVFGLLTLGAVAGLARALHPDDARAPLRAVALAAALPAAFIFGTLATPDAPLHLFWVLALWAAVEDRPLAAGAALGLAMLSKYTAVLLGPAVFFAFVLRRNHRGAALVVLVSLALFAPVVLWNAQHDWVSFAFQFKHGLVGAPNAKTYLEFLGGQAVMALPLLFLIRKPGPDWRRHLPVHLAWLVPVGFFAFAALRAKQEANWPAMAYVPLCALLAGDGLRARIAAAFGTAVLAALSFVLVLAPAPVPARPMLARFHGWSALRQVPVDGAQVVFAPTYQLASQAALYTSLPPRVVGTRRFSHYDVLPPLALAPGSHALWLSDGDEVPPALAAQYASVEPLGALEGTGRGRRFHTFHLWRLVDRR